MSQEIQVTTLDVTPQLVISDEDIHSIARSMDCFFPDEKRQSVLKCLSSCDVQAGPGSGKTTLLVAKLAILSSKWSWRDRGICVLSHTNVARQEVEKRLTHHPTAYRLLNYPHFIGTIQTFVDQFLAIPFLRSKEIEVSVIDNDRFASRASFLLGVTYRNAYGYLSKRRQLSVAEGLRFEGPDLQLGSAHGRIAVKETTPTYKELSRLKRGITKEGILRFDDMYAFAQRYTRDFPHLIEYLRRRFPYVFIDEIQDTDAMQNELLDSIFGDGCILQRFGDINQAIFHGGSNVDIQVDFPRGNSIMVPDCLRFGQKIASIASHFTAVEKQTLTGNPEHAQREHTVFLFDRDTIEQVIPAFGRLLIEEYQCNFPPGFSAISDYWHGFQPDIVSRSISPKSFIEYVRKAQHFQKVQQEFQDAHSILLEGILQFLRIQGARYESRLRFTKYRLKDALERIGNLSCFQDLLFDLLDPATPLNKDSWKKAMGLLNELTETWWEGELAAETNTFLEWNDTGTIWQDESDSSKEGPINLYRHKDDDGSVDIEIATIHSVKGETHTATLILETFSWSHDIQQLLPFLKATGDRQLLQNTHARNHMKCLFVAMTRPRELLCLAILKDHLQEGDTEALIGQGWNVCDLTMS